MLIIKVTKLIKTWILYSKSFVTYMSKLVGIDTDTLSIELFSHFLPKAFLLLVSGGVVQAAVQHRPIIPAKAGKFLQLTLIQDHLKRN